MLVKEEEAKEVATAAPKRWRNKYLVLRDYYERPADRIRRKGEEIWGKKLWPSAEIAEQKALEPWRDWRSPTNGKGYDYFISYEGPFPVEEPSP